jgi:hypothetical protein
VKLPPDTPVIMSTASSRRTLPPFGARTSVRRMELENARTRTQPPESPRRENASTTRFSGFLKYFCLCLVVRVSPFPCWRR